MSDLPSNVETSARANPNPRPGGKPGQRDLTTGHIGRTLLAFALPMGATLAVVVVYLARASLLAKRSKADAAAAAAPPAAPGAGDGGTVEMTTSAAGSQI